MKHAVRAVIAVTVCLLVLAGPARAEVKVQTVFGDNMVLQRDVKLPVWGQAAPGEKVTVTIGAAGVSTRIAEYLGAPAVLSNYTRLLIDPNRGEDDPTLVMRLSDGAVIPGNAKITEAEIERRVDPRSGHMAEQHTVVQGPGQRWFADRMPSAGAGRRTVPRARPSPGPAPRSGGGGRKRPSPSFPFPDPEPPPSPISFSRSRSK